MGVKVLAIGSYSPSMPGAWQEKFAERTGLSTHRMAGSSASTVLVADAKDSEETTVSMSGKAILACLGKCGLAIENIELLIYVSPIFEYLLGESTRIQKDVGAIHAAAYQIKGTAYAGVLLALFQASVLLQRGVYSNAVIVCVDHVAHEAWDTANGRETLGDDLASAILLSRCEGNSGIVAICNETLSGNFPGSSIEYGVRDEHGRYKGKNLTRTPGIKAEGVLAIEKAIQNYGYDTMKKVLEKARLSLSDIQWFIPINAGNAAKTEREALRIHPDHYLAWADDVTCTTSAVPCTLMEGMETGRFSPGDKILFYGADSGKHLVSAIWQW